MSHSVSCQGCAKKDRCHRVYNNLNNVRDSSLVSKVLVAFFLPIVIFILALGVFDKILAVWPVLIKLQHLRMTLGLVMALPVTFASILVLKMVFKRFIKG